MERGTTERKAKENDTMEQTFTDTDAYRSTPTDAAAGTATIGAEASVTQAASAATPKRRLTAAEKRKRRRRRRIKMALLWTLFLMATAVLVFCIVAIIFTAIERKAARDQYELIQSTYEILPTEEETAGAEAAERPAPTPLIDENKWYSGIAMPADKKIDFAALMQRNADVCAWITVEGTSIDYPVLRAEGKDVLYLSHDIDGKASEHGAVCIDVRCPRDFSDRMMLMYGHNMKDGSMFAPLYQYYKDVSFFQAGHRIRIYIDDAVLTYRVIAAYEHSDEHPLLYYDMDDDVDFAAYCNTFLGNRDMKANIDKTAVVGPDDHLLTLITSTNVRKDMRLFVQAVLEQ